MKRANKSRPRHRKTDSGRQQIVEVRTRDFAQFRFDAREFIGQYGLEQLDLSRKIRVQSFLADAELLSQIVHRHAAEPVAKEVSTRRVHDSLPAKVVLSILRRRFPCAFHVNVVLLLIA